MDTESFCLKIQNAFQRQIYITICKYPIQLPVNSFKYGVPKTCHFNIAAVQCNYFISLFILRKQIQYKTKKRVFEINFQTNWQRIHRTPPSPIELIQLWNQNPFNIFHQISKQWPQISFDFSWSNEINWMLTRKSESIPVLDFKVMPPNGLEMCKYETIRCKCGNWNKILDEFISSIRRLVEKMAIVLQLIQSRACLRTRMNFWIRFPCNYQQVITQIKCK